MTETFQPRETPSHERTNPPHNEILTTNPGLEQLCKRISSIKPDWTYLHKQMKRRGITDRDNAHGLYGEMHVQKLIRNAKRPNILGERIKTDLIPDGKRKGKYIFYAGEWGSTVVKGRDKMPIVEYDDLLEIDGLPVVIEVKRNSLNSLGKLNKALSDERITKIFAPLEEYYETKTFGYVVVTSQECIKKDQDLQNAFKERGGILIPFKMPTFIETHGDIFIRSNPPKTK